jgi:hypothetical protein
MTRSRARAAALLVTVALACTTAATPAFATSRPAPVPTRGQAASGWLARQMAQGSHLVSVFSGQTFPNQGATIDAIFAFAATKTANGFGARAIAWLGRPSILSNYIGNGTTESFAGATAKAALAAEVRGVNPARFGKVNLLRRLSKLLKKSGRYSDHSKFGDFSNAFSQSLAILALTRHGGAPASAARFLISSQCKNGGFPLNFGKKTCASDADSTAMDVQALLASGHRGAAVRGLNWLARVQQKNGGFLAFGGKVPNANTTGLAGEALGAAGRHNRAAHATKFLLSLQAGCSAKAFRRGAIAFDSTGFVRSTAIDATAQGILGIADVGLARLSSRGSRDGDPRLACSA